MKSTDFEPIEDRVLIRPTPPDSVIGGYELSEKEQSKKSEGTVVSVGPGVPLHNVELNISGNAVPEVLDRVEELIRLIKQGRPMQVAPGDYVLFGQYSGTRVKLEDGEFIMVREADVFSKMKKDA